MACSLLAACSVAKRTDRDSGVPRAYVFLKLFVQRAAKTKRLEDSSVLQDVRSLPIDDTTTGPVADARYGIRGAITMVILICMKI
jgi:hypothetical protein